jgi:hypothetical protein
MSREQKIKQEKRATAGWLDAFARWARIALTTFHYF